MRLERIEVVRVKDGHLTVHLGWQSKRKETPEQKADRLLKMKERLK